MPLSDHEQRLLDEIEQALYAEDPKFASSVRSARPHNRARTMLALSVLGTLLGLVVVIVGLGIGRGIGTAIGVLGFVLIVGSCAAAVSALRGPRQSGPLSMTPRPSESNSAKSNSLRTKMEGRMRRRFDDN
jgi:hypothetical protein